MDNTYDFAEGQKGYYKVYDVSDKLVTFLILKSDRNQTQG
jgi:hypothetical protein